MTILLHPDMMQEKPAAVALARIAGCPGWPIEPNTQCSAYFTTLLLNAAANDISIEDGYNELLHYCHMKPASKAGCWRTSNESHNRLLRARGFDELGRILFCCTSNLTNHDDAFRLQCIKASTITCMYSNTGLVLEINTIAFHLTLSRRLLVPKPKKSPITRFLHSNDQLQDDVELLMSISVHRHPGSCGRQRQNMASSASVACSLILSSFSTCL